MAKFNIKQAAINHVEKAVFGTVMLIVLIGLASTNWSSYSGTPEEIVEKVKQGRKTLYNNTWPDDEKVKYQITQENVPAQVVYEALRKEHNPINYEFSTKFITRPGGADEPLSEPDMYALQDPIASYSKVFITTKPPATETESEVTEDGTLASATGVKADPEDDDPTVLDEFRKKQNATAGIGSGSGYGSVDETYAMQASEMAAYNATYNGASEMGAEYGSSSGPGGEMYGAATGPKQTGHAYQFVSVRAIFPLRDQIRKYADAINRPYYEAASSFEIIDFNLERQAMQLGDKPWEGPWEPVDINVAYDILENAAGFEPDVINGLITNGVITMPLPMRISGQWRNQATHPRVKNFELNDEQVALEVEMNRKMLEEVIEERKAIRETEVQLGGFNHLQFNKGDLQAQLMGGDSMYEMGASSYEGEYGSTGSSGSGSGMMGGRGRGSRGATAAVNNPMEKLIEKLAEGADNVEQQKKLIAEWIKQGASVEGELLLFRYFDFSVEPGNTYRYRVRLVLNNPNYGMRVADAGGLASVVEGQTRLTDWSEITAPVEVEDTIKYFVADVRNPRITDLFPSANMDVFQWDAEHGTTINKAFEVDLGQKFSEKVKTEIIDPAQFTYENAEYTFTSKDFLVDTIEDIEIDDEFHSGERVDSAYKLPDLKGVFGKLALSGQVIVKDIDAGLKAYDPYRNRKDHEYMKGYMKLQADAFNYIKEAATAVVDTEYGSEYGDMYGEMYGGMGSEMGASGMSGKARSRNSLRRSGTRRGAPGASSSGGSSIGP